MELNEDFTKLYKRWSEGKDRKEDTYEYADLGLPSGLLWAKCNLGASNEYESGDFYSAGEVKPKDVYTYDNYSFDKSKYDNADSNILNPEDDAAHVNMRGNWRLPTYEDFVELMAHTTKKLFNNYNDSGVNVVVFKQKGNRRKDAPKVVFPLCGYMWGDSLHMENDVIMIRTANFDKKDFQSAVTIKIQDADAVFRVVSGKQNGAIVRGVMKKSE